MAEKEKKEKGNESSADLGAQSNQGAAGNSGIVPPEAVDPKSKKKDKEDGDEEVVVKRSELNLLFKKIEDLTSGQNILFKAADKGRIAHLQQLEGQSLVRQVKISKWRSNGQYIIGWKLSRNVSEILPGSNRWVEDQVTTIMFEDQTVQDVPLLEFYRGADKESADIVKTNDSTDSKGVKVTFMEVEFPNGKHLVIDSKFVN